MLQEVSRTRRVLSLVTAASLDEDAHCGDGARIVGLCDDSDAILNPCDLHRTIVLERCRYLTSGQITVILRSGSLAELESSFGLQKFLFMLLSVLKLAAKGSAGQLAD